MKIVPVPSSFALTLVAGASGGEKKCEVAVPVKGSETRLLPKLVSMVCVVLPPWMQVPLSERNERLAGAAPALLAISADTIQPPTVSEKPFFIAFCLLIFPPRVSARIRRILRAMEKPYRGKKPREKSRIEPRGAPGVFSSQFPGRPWARMAASLLLQFQESQRLRRNSQSYEELLKGRGGRPGRPPSVHLEGRCFHRFAPSTGSRHGHLPCQHQSDD